MKAISKNVAMGIFVTLALLSPLASCSLNSIFSSDQTGEVEISLTIPESLSRSTLPAGVLEALVPPESEASRFIHPDTRLIEATVSLGDGRKTISSSANVRPGETRATVTVRRIPMGDHKLTLSLYDAGSPPVLLSRGTTDISVRPKSTSQARVTAVPITENTFNAGPYSTDGITIDASHSGEILVYKTTLAVQGSYMLRCYNPVQKAHEPNDVSLYDSLGKKISTSTTGSGTEEGEYASLSSGVLYVVIDTPALGRAENLQVSLDADLRLTSSGDTVYVNPILTVFDRTRPFTINVPCGYSSESNITFGSAAGRIVAPILTLADEHTIIVDPGSDSLKAYANAGAGAILTFVDSLLGKDRTAAFDFPGAPRTFIYCNKDGLKPSGSKANAVATLDLAIDAANGLGTSDLPVIALLEGEKFSCGQKGFMNSACLLGGCSANGTRGAVFNATPVTCTIRNNGLSVRADYSHFSGIDFTIPVSLNVTGDESFISITGNSSTFTNCSFKYPSTPLTVNAPTSTFVAITVSAQDITFDRCSILGPTFNITDANTHSFYGILDNNSPTQLFISNSIIHAGSFNSAPSNNHTLAGISMTGTSSISLVLASSTVSSGIINDSVTRPLSNPPYARAVWFSSPSSSYFYTANSLLLNPDMPSSRAASNPFILTGGAFGAFSFKNMALGYANISSASYVLYLDAPNRITYPNWSTSTYASNYLAPVANLGFASLDPASLNFLKPTVSSPAALLSGGGDLSISSVRKNLSVDSLQTQYLILDRAGTARTGNGATGYTIGAYEVD